MQPYVLSKHRHYVARVGRLTVRHDSSYSALRTKSCLKSRFYHKENKIYSLDSNCSGSDPP